MKRILTIITRLFVLFAAVCCQNESTLYNEYAQVLSFKTYGVQKVALSLEEPVFDYSLTILKGGTDAGKPVTAYLTVLSQEEVDAEYNEKKGMSYKALPAELFDAPEKIEIGADASGIKVPVSFYAQDMYRSVTDDSNTYALVIRLTSEEGEVYKEKQDIVILPHFSPADLCFASHRIGMKLEGGLENQPCPVKVSYDGRKAQNYTVSALSQEYITEHYAQPELVNYVAVNPDLYEIPGGLSVAEGSQEATFTLDLDADGIIADMSKPENAGKVYVIPLKLTPASDLVISTVTEMLVVLDADITVAPAPGDGTGPYTWEVTKDNLDALSVAGSAEMGSPAISWTLSEFKGSWPKDDTDAGRGVQLGQSGTQTEITLTSTDYKGLVKAVVVRAAVAWDSEGGNTADISVYVNGDLVENHIPSIADNGFMNTDYVFMLKTPKVNPTIRVVYRSNQPKAAFLKSISILNKSYMIEDIPAEDKKAKWSTPYMTFNECGWIVKADVLFDGVEKQDAFLSHQVDEWRAAEQYKFGKPFVVIDLGEPVMISEIGYASSKSRWGRFIKEVEFFVYKGDVLPQVIDAENDWAAILNHGNSENGRYVDIHKKILENDAKIGWESVGSVREPNTHLQETYWHKVPYAIMEQTKARYVKLLITPFQKYWAGTTTSTGMVDRSEINEVYVKRVVSIDETPVN